MQKLQIEIDQIAELRGAGMAYIGDASCVMLRPARHTSGFDTFVILQEETFESDPQPPPSIRAELVALGLNCGSAVFSWAALSGEALAAPFTGGGSLALMLLTWGAAAASTAQCVTSIIRSVDVSFDSGKLVRWLDSEDWYSYMSSIVDAVSLMSAVGSTCAAVRAVKLARRATNRSLIQILKGMSRQERKRLTEEVIRLQANRMTNRALKDLIRSGSLVKRLTTSEINARLFRQIADAISASLEFSGSASSGDLKSLYVHVIQE